MINAHELRIGNWVSRVSDNQPFKVRDGEDIDDLGSTNSYEPIPLTPEILEKGGFVVEDRLGRGNSNTYFKKGMAEYITYQYDGFCIYELNQSVIKYLHQLQNLYFALTGQELEITPPA